MKKVIISGRANKSINRARVFISHASEDKSYVARPLATSLKRRGLRVWFDEYELDIGDSLKRKIDEGLAACDYGIVILSPNFFAKQWTREELDGLVTKEVSVKRKFILPIWHQVDHKAIAAFSPTLAGKLGISTKVGISNLAERIARAIEKEDIRLSVRELRLSSPHGGEIFVRARPNAPAVMKTIDLKDIEDIFKYATEKFTGSYDIGGDASAKKNK